MRLFQKALKHSLLLLGALFISALAVQSVEAATLDADVGGNYIFTVNDGGFPNNTVTLDVNGANHVFTEGSGDTITLTNGALTNCTLTSGSTVASCGTTLIASINIYAQNGTNDVTVSNTSVVTGIHGGSGADTFTLTAATGAVNFDPLAGTNIVNIRGTSAPTGVVNGSAGANTVNVTSATSTLSNIAADITLTDFDSDDDLFVNDSGFSVTGRTYTVTSTAISFGSVDITEASSTALNSRNLTAGTAIDTVNVQSTLAGEDFYYQGSNAADAVNVGNAGSVQSINGPLYLFNTTSFNLITLDDSADGTGRSVTVMNNAVTGIAPANIVFNATDVGTLTINGGTGADTFDVQATPTNVYPSNAFTLNAGGGSDTVNVHNTSTITAANFGSEALTFDGQGGTNTLSLDDSANAAAATTTWTSSTVAGAGTSATLNYSNFTLLSYAQGTNNDTLTVNSVPASSTFTITQGNGTDALNLNAVSELSVFNVDQGANNDSVTFTGFSGTANLTGGAGTNTINASSYGDAGTNNAFITVVDAYNVGGTQTFTNAATIGGAGSLGLNGTIIYDVANDGSFATDLAVTVPFVDGTSAGVLTKNGAGRMKLSGAGTYTGGSAANAGQLMLSNNTAAGTGSVTVGGSSQVEFTGATSVANNFSLATTANPAVIADNTATTAAISGQITLNSADNVFDVEGTQLSLTSIVLESGGARGLGKIGPGNLILATSSANTYTGNTNVNAGSLVLGSSNNNLANTGGNVTVASGAVFDVNGMTETIGGLAGAGNVSLGAGTLTFGGNNNTATHSGVVSGTGGNLVKTGGGGFYLTGTNTYTGTTTINQAWIDINNASALGTVAGNTVVASGATLYLDGASYTLAEPLNISGTGNGGDGAVNSFGGGAHTLSGTITLAAASRLRAESNHALTVSGVISGGFDLELYGGADGTTLLTLSGNNLYTGTTTVARGKALINGTQLASAVSVTNTTTLGGTGSVGAVTNASGGTVAPGLSPGTLTVTSLTLNSGSTASFELNGTTAGTQYDRIVSTGAVALGSATLTGSFGFVPSPGNAFTIVQGTSVTGTFNGLPNNTGFIFGGYPVYITYTATTVTLTRFSTSGGGSGGSSTVAPVVTLTSPSPATGTKPVNQMVACRLTDTNVTNPGLVTSSAKMTVNGVNVNASQVVVSSFSNSNGNTNTNSTVTIMDLTYTPATNFTSNTTVNVHCEVDNNNSLQGSGDFQFSVGSTVANANNNTNAVPNPGNANMNGSNSNTNASNDNTNGGSVGEDHFFTDISEHWASLYIDDLQTKCNVNGYQDAAGNLLHLFKPDLSITRAELITMVVKCKYGVLDRPTSDPFPDVDMNHWAAPYIAKAKELGIVTGYPSGVNAGKFLPNQNTNRAEALKIILLTWFNDGDVGGVPATTDCSDIVQTQWYAKYFNYALNKKIVEGYKDANGNPTGMCGPSKNVTRAESAKMIVNTKGLINF